MQELLAGPRKRVLASAAVLFAGAAMSLLLLFVANLGSTGWEYCSIRENEFPGARIVDVETHFYPPGTICTIERPVEDGWVRTEVTDERSAIIPLLPLGLASAIVTLILTRPSPPRSSRHGPMHGRGSRAP